MDDALTGGPASGGQRVATGRLIAFDFPSSWARERFAKETETRQLMVGTCVAAEVASGTGGPRRDRAFAAGGSARVMVLEVPHDLRFGPWERRPWQPAAQADGSIRYAYIEQDDVVATEILLD